MITSEQMRAARGLVNWSQAQLAEHSGVSLPTIKRMETAGVGRSAGDTIQKIERAFEGAGVEFIAENGGGAGVRLAKPAGRP